MKRLIPDINGEDAALVRSPAPLEDELPEVNASVHAYLRAGVSLSEMQGLRLAFERYRFGIPVDEAALRDDRIRLNDNGTLRAGTLLRLQRNLSDFREVGGVRLFRPDAVPGLTVAPTRNSPLWMGAGLTVALDDVDPSSVFAGRGYFGTVQLGLYF